jgi:HD-like signal output (HDOD) protein/ActR/RegA family two-component response regulator
LSAPAATSDDAPLRLLFAGADESVAAALVTALGDRLVLKVVGASDDALALVRREPFDAVLVQPRLAQGSGNALLGVLKREAPKLVRCLVLDDGRDAPALAALENLHRLLYQPLDAEALLAGLKSLLALRSRLESPRLAEAIGRIGRLPPPPALSLDLMRRTEDLDVAARDVAALVESDPTLAAKVLRLCNSAMYSGGRRIDDIHSAVVWLGNLSLRRLVMAGEIFGATRPKAEPETLDRLRETSLRASRLAARLLPGPRADLAATAALLGGVGRLLPQVRVPWAPQPGDDPAWPTYAEAGAYLLALWGLPETLVEAVAQHPTPAAVADPGLGVVGACHVAWALLGEVPLDEAWVAAQGLAGEREAWQALAAELRSEG